MEGGEDSEFRGGGKEEEGTLGPATRLRWGDQGLGKWRWSPGSADRGDGGWIPGSGRTVRVKRTGVTVRKELRGWSGKRGGVEEREKAIGGWVEVGFPDLANENTGSPLSFISDK